MKYNTSTLISNLEQKVEQQISFAIKILQNLPNDMLIRQPASGGWSIAEILSHLNTYGDYYLPLIKPAIESSSVSRQEIYKSGFLGDYFIKMISPVTGTKKIKAAKRHFPITTQNPEQIVSEFIRQQELLLQYLFKTRDINLAESRIPISIAKIIRLQLGDVLLFVINHIDRHLLQINRLLDNQEEYELNQ